MTQSLQFNSGGRPNSDGWEAKAEEEQRKEKGLRGVICPNVDVVEVDGSEEEEEQGGEDYFYDSPSEDEGKCVRKRVRMNVLVIESD